MNPRSIPVPERMAHLPLDKRGYPIFFGAMIDDDGTPYFTVNDDRKRELMVAHDLCSICGKTLLRGRWFAGGPASAFHERGAYIDMPMHDECVHYALRACPYLAAPRYGREVGQRQAESGKLGTVLVDPTMIEGRPDVFVAVMAIGQKMVGDDPFHQYVKPKQPYRKIEFWRHGRQLPADQAAALINPSKEN